MYARDVALSLLRERVTRSSGTCLRLVAFRNPKQRTFVASTQVLASLVVMLPAAYNKPLRKVQSTKSATAADVREVRKVPVPPHRLSPLKEHWLKIYTPVVEHLRLDIRFNVKSKNVEIRNPSPNNAVGSQHLQKAADFVKAFVYGFEVEDALALIRLDNLFVESFEVRTFPLPLVSD